MLRQLLKHKNFWLLDASNFRVPERNMQEIRYLPVTSIGWSLGRLSIPLKQRSPQPTYSRRMLLGSIEDTDEFLDLS